MTRPDRVGGSPAATAPPSRAFFDELGPERRDPIGLVSFDMAAGSPARSPRLPNAVLCFDPFHVVRLATDALDQVRRDVWNEARRAGQAQTARDLKGTRFALWKAPENLTTRQQTTLREIEQTNKPLYRAFLLKEHLRQIYRFPIDHALALLSAWLAWARAATWRRSSGSPHAHRAPRRHRRRDPPPPLQRARRSDQHPDPPDQPPRLRLPQRRRADRADDAQPRRPLPTTPTVNPTTHTTHGNVRRPGKLRPPQCEAICLVH